MKVTIIQIIICLLSSIVSFVNNSAMDPIPQIKFFLVDSSNDDDRYGLNTQYSRLTGQTSVVECQLQVLMDSSLIDSNLFDWQLRYSVRMAWIKHRTTETAIPRVLNINEDARGFINITFANNDDLQQHKCKLHRTSSNKELTKIKLKSTSNFNRKHSKETVRMNELFSNPIRNFIHSKGSRNAYELTQIQQRFRRSLNEMNNNISDGMTKMGPKSLDLLSTVRRRESRIVSIYRPFETTNYKLTDDRTDKYLDQCQQSSKNTSEFRIRKEINIGIYALKMQPIRTNDSGSIR